MADTPVDNTAMLDRLKSQLLTSGLQDKNQALFQVINQMLDFVRNVQTGVTTIKTTVTTIAGNYAKLDASNIFTKINPLITQIQSWIGPSDTTGIFFDAGNVGVRNNAPVVPVDVIGTTHITGDVSVLHDVPASPALHISQNPAGVSPPLSAGIVGEDLVTGDDTPAGTNIGIKNFVSSNIASIITQTLIGMVSTVGAGQVGNSFGYIANMNGTETGTRFAFQAQLTGTGTEYAFYCDTPGGIVYNEGSFGIGVPVPTASLDIKAGTATAGTAPIKFHAGTLLAALELGAMEFVDNGTTGHLYITLNVAGVLTRVQIV